MCDRLHGLILPNTCLLCMQEDAFFSQNDSLQILASGELCLVLSSISLTEEQKVTDEFTQFLSSLASCCCEAFEEQHTLDDVYIQQLLNLVGIVYNLLTKLIQIDNFQGRIVMNHWINSIHISLTSSTSLDKTRILAILDAMWKIFFNNLDFHSIMFEQDILTNIFSCLLHNERDDFFVKQDENTWKILFNILLTGQHIEGISECFIQNFHLIHVGMSNGQEQARKCFELLLLHPYHSQEFWNYLQTNSQLILGVFLRNKQDRSWIDFMVHFAVTANDNNTNLNENHVPMQIFHILFQNLFVELLTEISTNLQQKEDSLFSKYHSFLLSNSSILSILPVREANQVFLTCLSNLEKLQQHDEMEKQFYYEIISFLIENDRVMKQGYHLIANFVHNSRDLSGLFTLVHIPDDDPIITIIHDLVKNHSTTQQRKRYLKDIVINCRGGTVVSSHLSFEILSILLDDGLLLANEALNSFLVQSFSNPSIDKEIVSEFAQKLQRNGYFTKMLSRRENSDDDSPSCVELIRRTCELVLQAGNFPSCSLLDVNISLGADWKRHLEERIGYSDASLLFVAVMLFDQQQQHDNEDTEELNTYLIPWTMTSGLSKISWISIILLLIQQKISKKMKSILFSQWSNYSNRKDVVRDLLFICNSRDMKIKYSLLSILLQIGGNDEDDTFLYRKLSTEIWGGSIIYSLALLYPNMEFLIFDDDDDLNILLSTLQTLLLKKYEQQEEFNLITSKLILLRLLHSVSNDKNNNNNNEQVLLLIDQFCEKLLKTNEKMKISNFSWNLGTSPLELKIRARLHQLFIANHYEEEEEEISIKLQTAVLTRSSYLLDDFIWIRFCLIPFLIKQQDKNKMIQWRKLLINALCHSFSIQVQYEAMNSLLCLLDDTSTLEVLEMQRAYNSTYSILLNGDNSNDNNNNNVCYRLLCLLSMNSIQEGEGYISPWVEEDIFQNSNSPFFILAILIRGGDEIISFDLLQLIENHLLKEEWFNENCVKNFLFGIILLFHRFNEKLKLLLKKRISVLNIQKETKNENQKKMLEILKNILSCGWTLTPQFMKQYLYISSPTNLDVPLYHLVKILQNCF